MKTPVRILVCTDKFRGSLEAEAVAEAIKQGFLSQIPSADIVVRALADGGEGTAAVLTAACGGRHRSISVQNAVGERVTATYGISPDGSTAFLEMSQAAGLAMLPESVRNPTLTNTFGVGEMILDAQQQGVRRLILGIGGSATNDAGMGMATALGYRFLDQKGHELPPCGKNLNQVYRIDATQAKDLSRMDILVACDVKNPLFGLQGAAHIYAPQKGATAEMVKSLDEGLRHFAAQINTQVAQINPEIEGAGAAGGLGMGAMVFLKATLCPGIQLLIEETGLAAEIRRADFVITGEGKMDAQTLQGKVVAGVAACAAQYQKPVAAVCGTLDLSVAQIQALNLLYVESILTAPMSLPEAQEGAAVLLYQWAARFSPIMLRVIVSCPPEIGTKAM